MKRKGSGQSMLLGELFPEPRESLEGILGEHAFLGGLDKKGVLLLAKIGTQITLEAGTEILNEFDSDSFYLIHKGQIAIEQFVPGRGVVSIVTLSPGDALGWDWLSEAEVVPHSRARVIESSNLVAFKGSDLRAIANKHPSMGYFLAKRTAQLMVRQLQATQQLITEGNNVEA